MQRSSEAGGSSPWGNARCNHQTAHQWRKLRAFCLGVVELAWPPHLGIVLDYLQERVAEPGARTVPESVLAALNFMEKVGGVTVNERFSGQQVLNKFVKQSKMDLEGGAPATKKAPLLPIKLIGALELLVVDVSQQRYMSVDLLSTSS